MDGHSRGAGPGATSSMQPCYSARTGEESIRATANLAEGSQFTTNAGFFMSPGSSGGKYG